MKNAEVRQHLLVADQLSAASERYYQIGQEFADQALAVRKHVEDSFEGRELGIETIDAADDSDRPASLQVMPPLPKPKFERLSAALAADRPSIEADAIRRRRPVVDLEGADLEALDVAGKPWFWTRLFKMLAEGSAQPNARGGF